MFAATKRVLSPPGVEGASLPTSTTQVQGRGKSPMHDEGPSGEQEADFILIQDDDAEVENARLRMTIQEQNTEIQDLSLNLERDKWIISIWSRETNSSKTSMRSWSCKTSVRIDKLPIKGGSSSLPWSKRSTMTVSPS